MADADVSIRAGHPSEVMYEERRIATTRLAEQLRRKRIRVDLNIIEYVPGRRGVTQVEWTVVTIAATKLFDEVYDATKLMLIERRRAKKEKEGNAGVYLGVIIYGPDGERLKSWDTKDGE